MNEQTIEIPHLVYDIAKTRFPTLIITGNEDDEYFKNIIVNEIYQQSEKNNSLLSLDKITNQTDISITKP
ncbi:hypothetical protein [Mesoplasma melaleucae]|uniref:Uncharacterized protein n=1 Tax=Mesoplasma melaleucae TaxID=81459 RepID=A0A2K8NY62_9MOLU|nr:hypothetical protein [Mesoplasma melaleucae]ATZ18118.1 hypothetical protein EMELA_v1c05980 [Mesoplasma melaleucae]